MRAVLKFIIQVGLIFLLLRILIKYTTLDDKVVTFFRANSSISQTGSVVQQDRVMCTTPWGVQIPDGSSTYAYEQTSQGECKEEIRTCNGGILDGSYQSPACANDTNQTPTQNDDTSISFGMACTTPRGETVNDGAYIIAYESTNSCRFEKRYCQDGVLNGSFSAHTCYSPREVSQQPAQQSTTNTQVVTTTPNITTVNYGLIEDKGASDYQGPSRTSTNGVTTVIYSWDDNKTNPVSRSANDSKYIQPTVYRNFDLTQHGCMTPRGTYLDHGDNVIAYRSPTPESNGASCTYERRTCFQGMLGGSYAYSSCSLGDSKNIINNNGQDYYYPQKTTYYPTYPRYYSNAKSCTTSRGETVQHGDYVLAYKSSYTSQGKSCQGEYRYCNNGKLDGSYQNKSCIMSQDKYRCVLPRGGTVPHGSSVVAYANSSSPCASQLRTCNYGRLSGTYTYQSCEQKRDYYRSCQLPWGGTIPHGASAIAYNSPYGQCFSQKRTCYDGSLAGSYQFSSCSNNYNPHSRCAFGNCHGGYNNNHNNYHSCQLPRGGSIAHGASVTAYNSPSGSCYSQTRTCYNGYLNGSYQYGYCNKYPTCTGNNCGNNNYRSCQLPWGGSIAHGAKVEAYQSTSAPCYKQTRTCNNGYLDGNYQYSYCNATNPGGGQDYYGNWIDVGVKQGDMDGYDTCNNNSASSYLCGSEGTNSCTDYSRVSCTSFSPLVCTYWKRDVKCVK